MKVIKKEKVKLEDGSEYEGEWSFGTGLIHGKGVQSWPDGGYYEGYWRNGQASGKGRLVQTDGNVYEGD